jgi:CRISPR/Cas system-associated exonuclease Cas4 (RecB family)
MAEYQAVKKIRSADWNYGGTKWKLSRSKIDLFMECPRCFYLDNKLGVGRPRGPAFTLNIAVDALLKKEFDVHRAKGTAHPLMSKYGVSAVPYMHKDLDVWRTNFTGLQYRYEPTGFIVSGAIDDVWVNEKKELMVVDYKATAKEGRIDSLDDTKWQNQYRRQMEVYQWLLRKIGFPVSNTGYFVYVNGQKDKEAFDARLEFDVTLIAHEGKDEWIPKVLQDIKTCLENAHVPKRTLECEYCNYLSNLEEVVADLKPKKQKNEDIETRSLF